MRALAALALLVLAPSAAAETWIALSGVSYHFHRDKPRNELNVGVGIEYAASPRWRLVAGMYHNSNYQTSTYAGAFYSPWQVGRARFGTVLGIVTGYSQPLPLAIPAAAWEGRAWGVNVTWVPGVVMATQVKLRFE